MIEINLHKPGELDVKMAFPSSWDDLLPNEVMSIAKLILSSPQSEVEARASLLINIISDRLKSQKVKVPKNWKLLLDPENIVQDIFPLLDFIYDENNLTVLPIKSFKLTGAHNYTVYGPEKGFEDITCGEYEVTEQHYYSFIENPNTESICKLVAAIFREKGRKFHTKNGNDTLDAYPFEKWAKAFSQIEEYKLYSIFIWYSGCRNQLVKMYPTVHEPGDDTDIISEPVMQFTNCIHAGAGAKNGTRNNIRLMSLLEFYHDMEQEAIKAKKLKESYEQSK